LDYSALLYGIEKIRYHDQQLAHALVGMPNREKREGCLYEDEANIYTRSIIHQLRHSDMRIFHSPPILSHNTTFVQIFHFWANNNGLQQTACQFSKGGQV
jgi:hypothetical protein